MIIKLSNKINEARTIPVNKELVSQLENLYKKAFLKLAEVYILDDTNKDVKAEGFFTGRKKTFVVKEGSTFIKDTNDSLPKGAREKRDSLINEGFLKLIGDKYLLISDQEFTSKSQAAEAILGRSASGNVEFNK